MSSRAERLQVIAEQHAPTVGRMRAFAEGVITPSIDSLQSDERTNLAIQMFLNGLSMQPQHVEFRGKTLAQYKREFRNQLGNDLYRYGLRQFQAWYQDNLTPKKREEVLKRIMDRNMRHFIDSWSVINKGKFPEPDWEEMEKAHHQVMEGTKEPVYGLYAAVFHGFQVSAIELYIEDTAPPSNVTNRFLLD